MDTQRLKPASERSLTGTSRLVAYFKSLWARSRGSGSGVYGLAAFVAILLAVLLRLLILQKAWPTLDSDEATMGLMALHILKNGEHPLVFYGQDYMGTIQAYLAALSFAILGPGVFALRLVMVLLFALFLVATYLLISLLYSRKAALIGLCVLSLGSPEIMFHELEANGGYGEIFFFGVLLLWLASWLALTSRQGPHLLHISVRRALVYVIWSVVAGLAIWSDPLIVPFVVVSGLLVVLFCRSELRLSIVALLVFGFLLGVAPQLLYKAVAVQPPPTSLFGGSASSHAKAVVSGQAATAMTSASTVVPAREISILGQLVGSVMVSVPVITGGSALCGVQAKNADQSLYKMDGPTLRCTLVHGAWGIGYLALLLVAMMTAYRLYWRRWEQSVQSFAARITGALWLRAPAPAQPLEDRQGTIRQAARLAVLVSAALTWFLYTLFPQAELSPWASSRYLVGLLMILPALLAFLWEMAELVSPVRWQNVLRAGASYALVLVVVVTFLVGTLNLFNQFPSVASQNAQQLALLVDLRQANVRYMYTDYWTCDRLAFQSLEEIRCSVLQDQLTPGLNRYQPYADQVAQATQPWYVFPQHSAQDENFAQLNVLRSLGYTRVVKDGYAMYSPAG